MRRTGSGRTAAVVATLCAAMAVAGCSSHSSSKKPTATPATRWWSNAAVSSGSTIDPGDPSAAAAKLHSSRSDYCGMLKSALSNGSAILASSAGAAGQRQVVVDEAFVAEVEAVAPSEVVPQWQVIGPVILQIARSGSTALPSASAAQNTANLNAAVAINNDAKKNCRLDLSKVLTGS
jgi:hypothetical protein